MQSSYEQCFDLLHVRKGKIFIYRKFFTNISRHAIYRSL